MSLDAHHAKAPTESDRGTGSRAHKLDGLSVPSLSESLEQVLSETFDLFKREQFEQALSGLDEVEQRFRALPPSESDLQARFFLALGACLQKVGRGEEAKSATLDGLAAAARAEKTGKTPGLPTTLLLLNYGVCLCDSSEFDQALMVLQQARDRLRRFHPQALNHLAHVEFYRGRCLLESHGAAHAEDLKRAQRCFATFLGLANQRVEVMKGLTTIALYKRGDFEIDHGTARKGYFLLRQAVRSGEREFGADAAVLLPVRYKAAIAALSCLEWDDASVQAKAILRISCRTSPPDADWEAVGHAIGGISFGARGESERSLQSFNLSRSAGVGSENVSSDLGIRLAFAVLPRLRSMAPQAARNLEAVLQQIEEEEGEE